MINSFTMKKIFIMLGFLLFLLSGFQNSNMKVKQGETFKIVLESNHSTGYGWYWENKPEKSIIDSIYVDYKLKSKMLTGSGGNEIWEFKASHKGEQMIRLVYKRPWESEAPKGSKEILIKVN